MKTLSTVFATAVLAMISATVESNTAAASHAMPSSQTETLLAADRAFNARAQAAGVAAAFVEFAAADAVLYRNGMEPVIGREAIAQVMAGDPPATLAWEPLTADIAASGDLGYTRGSFSYQPAPGPDGAPTKGPFKGYYVTIWRKQADGTWRWVFDSGIVSQVP